MPPSCQNASVHVHVPAGANKKVIDRNPLTEVQKIFEIYTQDTLQYECCLIMMPLVLSERRALYLLTIVSSLLCADLNLYTHQLQKSEFVNSNYGRFPNLSVFEIYFGHLPFEK